MGSQSAAGASAYHGERFFRVVLATEGTVRRGSAKRHGETGTYYGLISAAPHPRIRRDDLTPGAPGSRSHRSILSFVHFADMHVVDVQSPGRYEFMERLYGGPEALHVALPAFRPQECLHLQACEAMMRTINRIHSGSVTGTPLDLMISTGDNLDNQQSNELAWFLGLMTGGSLQPSSGESRYEGVQGKDWPDRSYWHPDGAGDAYMWEFGFPAVPGLLEEAMKPFWAEGVRLPWLSAYGNHDALILGAARTNSDYDAVVTGALKAQSSPEGFIPDHLSEFIAFPERFLGSPFIPVTPDGTRRPCSRAEYLSAHGKAVGRPSGHGFAQGELYYVFDDIPGVRIIMLDTTNPAGGVGGSLGAGQARWLEERIQEVSQEGSHRLVVLCSHHSAHSMTNTWSAPQGTPGGDEPRLTGGDIESLLHRFPNVVLWLNGHTHRHRVRPCPGPGGHGGFWEVTTGSLIDWPVQCRLVELVRNEDSTLSIHCTPVDSDVPVDPNDAEGFQRLASLHRELAANDPHAGMAAHLDGLPADRTVELIVPAPFEVEL